jgi:8-oxo-(d)GTP phosphatase
MATVERIEGAGAVLWQATNDGDVTIAIIHRPRYDDWSLPKGGVDAGESHIQAAFREVLEETGVKAIFGPEIGTVDYEVNGVTKEVRYWLAEADQYNAATPNPEEVDATEWLSISDAINKLSNSDDREIVRMAEEFGFGSTPLVLLRHAKALKRDQWDGDDGDRPLEHVGQIQAAKIPAIYAPYAIEKFTALMQSGAFKQSRRWQPNMESHRFTLLKLANLALKEIVRRRWIMPSV